jgi:hypothetical protein
MKRKKNRPKEQKVATIRISRGRAKLCMPYTAPTTPTPFGKKVLL